MAYSQRTEGQTNSNSPSECYNNAQYQCSDHNTPLQSPSALNSPNLHQPVPTQHNSPVDHTANLDQTLSNQSRSNQPTTNQLEYGEASKISIVQNQPVHNSLLHDPQRQLNSNVKRSANPLQSNALTKTTKKEKKKKKKKLTFKEMMQEANEAIQEANDVRREANEVRWKSEEVMREAEEVMRETEVTQEAEEAMREADEVMRKAYEFMEPTTNTDWKVTGEELEAYEQVEKSLQHDLENMPRFEDQLRAIPNWKYLVREKHDVVEAEKAAEETHEEVVRMLSNLKQPKLRTQESGVAKILKPAQPVAQV